MKLSNTLIGDNYVCPNIFLLDSGASLLLKITVKQNQAAELCCVFKKRFNKLFLKLIFTA